MRMARVPTWTELRLDAKKLAKIQKECYNSVHRLLDLDIPALDRKISMLNGKSLSSQETTPSIQDSNQEEAYQQAPAKNIGFETHIDQISHRYQTHDIPSNHKSINLNDNPHLIAPPLPLSEYLVRNRPDMVRRATRRALYVKSRADRRKFRNETKLINSFQRLKLASNYQTAESNRTYNSRPTKQTNRPTSYNTPTYSVRYKLSESEMKKLTARTYKRLPEVKLRHKEEVTNHIKALNHKNRLEYARKLTENRKNGIINYPLTSSYDERSLTSTQSEYSINSCSGSGDMHRW